MNTVDTESPYSSLLELYSPQNHTILDKTIRDKLSNISRVMSLGGISQGVPLIPDSFYTDRLLRSSLNHELFSSEYYQKLGEFIQDIKNHNGGRDFSVLEVGAGNGNFGELLQGKIPSIPIYVTDPNPTTDNVDKLGYWDAIKKYQPNLVIAVWPRIIADAEGGSMFIETLRHFLSIQGCILIGTPSRCQFHQDDFSEYRYSLGSSEEFFHISDLYELSNLQIGMNTESGGGTLKNSINPLLLRDQGIDNLDKIGERKNFATSRTQFLYRDTPGWGSNSQIYPSG